MSPGAGRAIADRCWRGLVTRTHRPRATLPRRSDELHGFRRRSGLGIQSSPFQLSKGSTSISTRRPTRFRRAASASCMPSSTHTTEKPRSSRGRVALPVAHPISSRRAPGRSSASSTSSSKSRSGYDGRATRRCLQPTQTPREAAGVSHSRDHRLRASRTGLGSSQTRVTFPNAGPGQGYRGPRHPNFSSRHRPHRTNAWTEDREGEGDHLEDGGSGGHARSSFARKT